MKMLTQQKGLRSILALAAILQLPHVYDVGDLRFLDIAQLILGSILDCKVDSKVDWK